MCIRDRHGRTLTGQGCAAVIEEDRLGQLVLLGQGEHEGLEQGLAQLLGPFPLSLIHI